MPFDLLCCVRSRGAADVVELDYAHHTLTDVPSEVFTYERTLEVLFCQCNRISELPRQLFCCHGLRYLDLSDNEIQAIPIAISCLVNLRHLNLSKNALTSLPESAKSLKHLFFLDLSANPLEKLPEAITNLIALQELYLNDTYLEFLPGNFGRLANLRILELRDNYLMILPKSLARATELARLDLGQNEFQQFPEVIGKLVKLRELWIDCNSLTSVPALVKPLACLLHLELSGNMIEEIAPDISYCTELLDLSLSSNNISQLPDSVGNLAKLATLKLDNNKLYVLPDSIGQMSNLEELMLMTNYLDHLPSSIGLLRKLTYLNADENMLRMVPPEIGSCSKLSVLSLRCNKLTSIPPEIGHLSSLRVLNLVRNSLSSLPQSLLNCDNLVALWLSENQSKPLVPIHSEVDPHTYQQVLTCLLLPQVPLSPVESKLEDKNVTQETQNSSRHISFVDMKATPKVPEKPGQLRRAPTPYPKELRALAKHARNIHKDGTQDVSPPVQNVVQIKAAKITPTLQQRFATDQKSESESNELLDRSIAEANEPLYDTRKENPYDKSLDLNFREEKTYQSVDHTLYGDPNDNYGIYKDSKTNDGHSSQLRDRPCEVHTLRSDIIDGRNPVSQNTYGPVKYDNFRHPGDGFPRPDSGSNFQRLSIASNERVPSNGNVLCQNIETYSQMPLIDNRLCLNQANTIKENPYSPAANVNYHGSVYDSESYAHAKEKIYARRRYDAYKYTHGNRDVPSPRLHTVSQAVSNSTTMPNIRDYSRPYAETDQVRYFSGPIPAPSPNANIYPIPQSSPTYLPHSHDLYSPTGHDHTSNPYRMTDTPLISEDGSYSQLQSPLSQTSFNIYETLPTASTSTGVAGRQQSPSSIQPEPIYTRQPPPYHIAAPFTKQAQYFNGTT